ncbi:nitrate/nitrite transporter NrtS [Devosia sp. BSSL-BM10]|uniref:Nitrate/nitrite transporter NrtS n=1 Tax=Devosia litorisediminis TaxID=2829817 RepID=A0A942EEZ8_9HYPH|nr:nitrate/nitrite transporter NrtS [Devosia litorisediminis]
MCVTRSPPSHATPLQRALSPQVLRKSLLVAFIVGSVLNLINQGDAMMSGQGVSVFKIVLTYCVPFLVSTYGAWSMARLIKPDAS